MSSYYFKCEECNKIFSITEDLKESSFLCEQCVKDIKKEFNKEIKKLDIDDPEVIKELEKTLTVSNNETDEEFSEKIEEYTNDKKIKKRIAKLKKKLKVD